MSEEKTQTQANPYFYGWREVWRQDEKGEWIHENVPLTEEDILHPQEGDHIVEGPNHDTDRDYLANVIRYVMKGGQYVVSSDLGLDWEVEGERYLCPDVALLAANPDTFERNKALVSLKDVAARVLMVIEIVSPSTRNNDFDKKFKKYHLFGVPFYALVDYRPDAEHREVVLLGFRWTEQGYVPLSLDERGRLWLEPVNLWLAPAGDHVDLFDEHGIRFKNFDELATSTQELTTRSEELQSNAEEAILARHDALRKLDQEEKARKAEETARKHAEQKAADEEKARKDAEAKAADQENARRAAEKARSEAEKARSEAEKACSEAEKARNAAEKACQEAEKRAADLDRSQQLAEKKAADLAARLADLEAQLRRLGSSSGDPA